MRNFAEELTYWFFRLNGFFILDDFVLHKLTTEDEKKPYNADIDILAIRTPFCEEIIEENSIRLSDIWKERNIDIVEKWTAVICEVKSGDAKENELKINRPERLQYALKRIGFFKDDERAIRELSMNKVYNHGNYAIHKFVISECDYQEDTYHIHRISIKQIREEIIAIINQNKSEKESAKIFFPSNLMQYLIWGN